MENPYLVLSSILFVIPTTVAAYKRHWILYATFGYVTIVSSLYHATKYQPLLYLDYPGVCIITVVPGIECWKSRYLTHYFIIGTMIIILYWGGWFTGHLIFADDPFEQTISHAAMHLLANVGGIATCLISKNGKKTYRI